LVMGPKRETKNLKQGGRQAQGLSQGVSASYDGRRWVDIYRRGWKQDLRLKRHRMSEKKNLLSGESGRKGRQSLPGKIVPRKKHRSCKSRVIRESETKRGDTTQRVQVGYKRPKKRENHRRPTEWLPTGVKIKNRPRWDFPNPGQREGERTRTGRKRKMQVFGKRRISAK